MSYYIVKVYGLVCDVCEASEEATPRGGAPHPLAYARRELRGYGWRFVNGKDICPKHPETTAARGDRRPIPSLPATTRIPTPRRPIDSRELLARRAGNSDS